jgi:hypothetical protein
MSKEEKSTKPVVERAKPKNRHDKEKQTWKRVDMKQPGNARIRRISGNR